MSIKKTAVVGMGVTLMAMLVASVGFGEQVDSEAMRRARLDMVREQVAARGVDDEAVLEAMRTVPRHLMIPERYRQDPYGDHPAPIGYGQTISQPYIVGYMSEQLDIEPGERVLEVGTGSGYQAAILAQMTTNVYTIEIVPELARAAGKTFERLGYDRIALREGDGYFGWPEAAPFDAIVVTAAAEHVPPPLVEQLKRGGTMCIPVGARFGVQYLLLVEKDEAGKVTTRNLMPVRFVPLTREKE